MGAGRAGPGPAGGADAQPGVVPPLCRPPRPDRRDLGATRASAEAVLALARAQELAHRGAQGRLLRGWARAMQGDAATGVAQMAQGWDAVQRTGLQLYRP